MYTSYIDSVPLHISSPGDASDRLSSAWSENGA